MRKGGIHKGVDCLLVLHIRRLCQDFGACHPEL
jgi:hypothetical protein